ncbi:hypothetical protein HDE_02045 [Halotydeus destructor]|nr:hypothetical protein HDE_02045 [Halotydeus destructor]
MYKSTTCYTYIARTLIVLCFVAGFPIPITDFAEDRKLRQLEPIMFRVGLLVIYIWILSKYERLQALSAKLDRAIADQNDRTSLLKMQYWLIGLIAVFLIKCVVEDVMSDNSDIVFQVDLILSTYTTPFAYTYMFIYVLLVQALSRAIRGFFNVSLKRNDVSELRKEWIQIVNGINEFEDLMSTIPLMFTSCLFFECLNFMTRIARLTLTMAFIYDYIISIFIDMVTVVYVVHVIESSNAASRRLLWKFRSDIVHGVYSREHELLYQDMVDTIEMKLTANSMFVLDYSAILNITSALISMTILFRDLDP